MNLYVVTDPVNDEIPEPDSQTFEEAWAEIGQAIKKALDSGPNRTTWVNITGTHVGDCMADHVVHRTIAPVR